MLIEQYSLCIPENAQPLANNKHGIMKQQFHQQFTRGPIIKLILKDYF